MADPNKKHYRAAKLTTTIVIPNAVRDRMRRLLVIEYFVPLPPEGDESR